MKCYHTVTGILLLTLLTGVAYGEDAVELSIDSVTVPADYRDEVTVPVNIVGVSGMEVHGISFKLTYDGSILEYVDATKEGSVADDWTVLIYNDSIPGQISIVMARVTPLSMDGVLLKMTFDIVDTVQPCQVSPLEFSNVLVNDNDGFIPATSRDGEVSIGECQCLLYEGWNLYGFSVNKCFYEGTPPTQPACVEMVDVVNDLGFGSMSEWFDSIITPVNPVTNVWRIVIGTNGVMDRTLSPSSHSLKYMTVTAGYWVKIEDAAGGASLSLPGAPFDPSCAIPLLTGWSIVSYPLSTGYHDTNTPPTVPGVTNWVKVPRPVGAYVFASITGRYRIIIGQQGVYDPTLSASSSSLRWVAPCTAYWIKMNEPWNLVYANMGITSSALAAPPITHSKRRLLLHPESR